MIEKETDYRVWMIIEKRTISKKDGMFDDEDYEDMEEQMPLGGRFNTYEEAEEFMKSIYDTARTD